MLQLAYVQIAISKTEGNGWTAMVLLSWTSGLILLVMVGVFWLLPASSRSLWLALSNIALLLYWYPGQGLLMLGLAMLTFLLGEILRRWGQRRTWLLVLATIVVSFYLLYTKYFAFLLQILNQALQALGQTGSWHWEQVAVPVGISFVTFRWLHYVIDSYRGKVEQRELITFLGYSFFWPILTSGPIERWQDFSRQLGEKQRWRWNYLWEGLERILLGLFKKLLVAAALAPLASGLSKPGLSAEAYWLAAHAYAWQLYVDFSGYTDLAVGSSRLFGLRIQENFDWPYLRGNISLFWKHWHMSLTRWFRDYLFIPLGGSRVAFRRILFNTLVVMFVTGLWHGAGWNFIFWGMLHAGALILWRLYRRYLLPRLPESWPDQYWYRGLAIFITYNFVVLAWIPFTTNLQQALRVLQIMGGGG